MSIRQTVLASAIALATLGVSAASAATVYNGHQYDYITGNVSWTAAHTAATGLGAGWDLVSITDAAENNFVISLIGAAAGERNHVWIGASDAVTEGTFTWSNGDAFGFTDWHSGEPNNSGNEDYAALDFRGSAWHWNDVPDAGYQNQGYVVESAVPEPATWAMFLLGFGAIGFSMRRRQQAALAV